MKSILLILILFCKFSFGQTSIDEIEDKKVQQRVLQIISKTDSFIKKIAHKEVINRLVPEFGVTYIVGEFYQNYLFLNKYEEDPRNIYNLTQYYSINDTSLRVRDTIGIYYLEIINQFAPEVYSLIVRFKTNADYLKLKALNYLYESSTQEKLKSLIKSKKINAPFIKISVDAKSNTFFVFVKDKDKLHNYTL